VVLNEKTVAVKRNKIGIVFLVVISLLLFDYLLKVREYNHLVSADKKHNESFSSWSEETRTYRSNCTEQSYVTEEIEKNCEEFISKSDTSAGQIYVQNNQLNRFFVAPWHREMKYAYKDLSALIENDYEFIAGWEIQYDKNGWGDNLRNNVNWKVTETSMQFYTSLTEAKPFPGIFLDSAE
jgi:hypothetical protein